LKTIKRSSFFSVIFEILLLILLVWFALQYAEEKGLIGQTSALKSPGELSQDYAAGKIETPEYIALLQQYAGRAGKKINHKRAQKELQAFLKVFKEMMPDRAYEVLLNDTDNFRDTGKLYSYLIGLCREHNIDLSAVYPELGKFFDHVELNRKIEEIKNRQYEAKDSDEKADEQQIDVL
jgi:hypothetical protein